MPSKGDSRAGYRGGSHSRSKAKPAHDAQGSGAKRGVRGRRHRPRGSKASTSSSNSPSSGARLSARSAATAPNSVEHKIFVGGLNYTTTSEVLVGFFSQFGPVATAEVIRNRVTGRSRGFGFVVFETEAAFLASLEQRTYMLEGKSIEVKAAVAKSAMQAAQHGGAAAPAGSASASHSSSAATSAVAAPHAMPAMSSMPMHPGVPAPVHASADMHSVPGLMKPPTHASGKRGAAAMPHQQPQMAPGSLPAGMQMTYAQSLRMPAGAQPGSTSPRRSSPWHPRPGHSDSVASSMEPLPPVEHQPDSAAPMMYPASSMPLGYQQHPAMHAAAMPPVSHAWPVHPGMHPYPEMMAPMAMAPGVHSMAPQSGGGPGMLAPLDEDPWHFGGVEHSPTYNIPCAEQPDLLGVPLGLSLSQPGADWHFTERPGQEHVHPW